MIPDVLTNLTKIRNIGITAHIGAGKTTMTEHILFHTGIDYKIGEMHDDTSATDWMEQEQERGITITSAATTCFQKNNQINIIDTPGHVDFTVEVGCSLRMLDGAVVVFDGKEGVEPQSETVWRQADKHDVPRICYISKMDRLGADFNFSVQTIYDRLRATPVVLNFPIGTENDFSDFVDILEVWTIRFLEKDADGKETRGFIVEYEKIPSELVAKAEGLRTQLVETVAETDDALMEKYLGGEELSVTESKAGIRKLTVTGEAFPALAGSVFKNKGIQPVLDTVLDYLPSPLGISNVENHTVGSEEEVLTRPTDEKAPFSALAFKMATHPSCGKLVYVRVYFGKVSQGEMILNATKDKGERIGKLFQMHPNKESPVEEAHADHIYAFIGLEDVTTGDTLCAQGSPIILESMTFPAPVIHMTIEPETKGDQEKLGVTIQKLSEEGPTFTVSLDEGAGQTVVDGMGELHLDMFVDRMRHEFKVKANVGAPQVAYRETIRKKVDKVEYTHKKQMGDSGQFAKAQINFKPLVADEAAKTTDGEKAHYEFANTIIGDRVSREYIPSVDAGIQDAILTSVLAGYPMVDIKATLTGDAYHEVDSSEVVFKVAGSMASREGVKKALPVLLEPVMAVEVRTPEEYTGDVISDLNSRRGVIASIEDAVGVKVIRANVSLLGMFGYVDNLRSRTQGCIVYPMTFSSYAEVPKNTVDEIIAKVKGA